MTRVVWGAPGAKKIETGLDRGMLYPEGYIGVPWDGLRSLTETPSGSDIESFYYDGNKYTDVPANEDFQASLEAFTFPEAFTACDGTREASPGMYVTQQPKLRFGLCYRNWVGNDLAGQEAHYKLHFVYNATAVLNERVNNTLSDASDFKNFSWTLSTIPVPIPGFKPSAHFYIDSSRIPEDLLELIEAYLYGGLHTDPRLPLPEELIALALMFDPRIIIEDIFTGLSPLDSGMGDLMESLTDGIYIRLPNSRLTETATPGFFVLEE